MFIVHHRKFFYAFSGLLFLCSIAALFVWGLKPGIDFTGGSILQVDYATSTRPTAAELTPAINALKLGDYSIRETGATGYIIRTTELTPAQHDAVMSALSENGTVTVTEKEFDSVGPILGQEALQKSWISIGLVILAIVLFITFAFRRVSRPVKSWKYGVIAIVALAHDVILPAGVFAVLGHFFGIEVDTLFVTALLVVLGFSIHDTIVVFDRVRENLKHDFEGKQRKPFDAIVGESISQTFVRSVNTSLTTLIAIAVLYIAGAPATQPFALALLVGITSGTYSSIFLGSPLLVTVYKWQEKQSA
ncbi:MAG: protein translocase subunit SecF [Patescibacteria group bacterium]|nr:protein translocase subunit SecF [Patescibacteria group bacterium]MDE2116791.1 protein translocase subunit SecF [Patescibacteria group bacterium]